MIIIYLFILTGCLSNLLARNLNLSQIITSEIKYQSIMSKPGAFFHIVIAHSNINNWAFALQHDSDDPGRSRAYFPLIYANI